MVIKFIPGPSGMDELTQGKNIGKRELWEVPHLTEKRERGTCKANHERAVREVGGKPGSRRNTETKYC